MGGRVIVAQAGGWHYQERLTRKRAHKNNIFSMLPFDSRTNISSELGLAQEPSDCKASTPTAYGGRAYWGSDF